MGKSKEQKQAQKNINHEYDYQTQQRQANAGQFDPSIAEHQANASEDRGAYQGALGNLSDVGNQFLGTHITADTGALAGDSAAYKNFAEGKGETGDFFRNLMNTGGYTASELGDIRSAGNRQIPSFFANLKNNLRTAQNATGGYSPGYSSGSAAMARDAAHQAQEAALDTELGISDRVRTGKLTGANTLNSMFLGGMQGATGADKAISDAQLQAAGLTLQGQGIGAGLLGQATSGFGNLYGMDQNAYYQDQALKMKAQGMSDDAIARVLGMQSGQQGTSGMDKAKLGASIAVPIIVAI